MKNLLYGASLVLLFFASVAAVVAVLLNKEKSEEDSLLKSEGAASVALVDLDGQSRVSFGVAGGRLVLLSNVKVKEKSPAPASPNRSLNLNNPVFARLLDDTGREMLKVRVPCEEVQVLTAADTELKALPPKLSFAFDIPSIPRTSELELFFMQGPSGLKSLGRFSLPPATD